MRQTFGFCFRTSLLLLVTALWTGSLSAQESKTEPPKEAKNSQQKKDQEKDPASKQSGDNEKPKPETQKPENDKQDKPAQKPSTGVSNVDRTHILNDLTFDDLKFEMSKDEDFRRSLLSKKIESYHGTTVRLRGYMRPGTKQSGITRFIFVRDNQECCFGEQAAIYDNVLVKLSPDKKASFTVRPITIEGKFALKEYIGPNRKVWSLYRMYDAEVK